MIVNWNTDEEIYKKNDPNGYKIWRVRQALEFGGKKVSKKFVTKNWNLFSKDLDIDTKKAVEFLVWGKKWIKEPGLLPDRSNYLAWLVKTRNLEISSI